MPDGKSEHLHQRINAKIRQIEARKFTPPILFFPHFPRYHDGALRVDCVGCGDQFKSFCLDSHEFARMLSWQNEHIASCAAKETGH